MKKQILQLSLLIGLSSFFGNIKPVCASNFYPSSNSLTNLGTEGFNSNPSSNSLTNLGTEGFNSNPSSNSLTNLGTEGFNSNPSSNSLTNLGTSISSSGNLRRLTRIVEYRIPNFFNQLFSQFTSIANSYTGGEITTFLNDTYGLSNQLGSIGLPDFQQIEQQLEDRNLDLLSDLFGTKSGVNFSVQSRLRQDFLQDFGTEFVKNSIFSDEGQDKIQSKISQALQTVDYSAQLQQDSSAQDVSQNILRNLSGQLSLQQQIDNMVLFEMQEQKVKDGLQIEISAEILEEIGKSNIRSERENLATVNSHLHQHLLVSIPGQE